MTAWMLEAAARGLALALIAGAGLAVLRVKHVPVQKATWMVVLLASAAMPALMRWPVAAGWPRGFAWVLPVPASRAPAPAAAVEEPIWPVVETTAGNDPADSGTVVESSSVAANVAANVTVSPAPAPAAAPKRWAWPPLGELMLFAYLAVAGLLLLRLLVGLGAAVRLWMTADPVSPLTAPVGHVRASRTLASPVTVGSGVVLPGDYAQWDARRLRLVLEHEQSHVRQGDFYLQLLAGLYTAVFWFSPLGWWLKRRLAQLGEAISDRAGLEAAANGPEYAQVVLEFAAIPHRNLPGVAMARSGNVARRIDAMLNESWLRTRFVEGRRRALASLAVLPVALFAVTALVRVPPAEAQASEPPAPPPQSVAVEPGPQVPVQQVPAQPSEPRSGQAFAGQGPNAAQVTVVAARQTTDDPAPRASAAPAAMPQAELPPAVPPAPPIAPHQQIQPAPLPPAPPPLPAGKGSWAKATLNDGRSVTVHTPRPSAFIGPGGQSVNGYAYHFSMHGDSYALVQGPGTTFDFSGNWDGIGDQLKAARRMAHGPFLWFTRGGRSYIVTDPAEIARIEALYQAMQVLRQQEFRIELDQRPPVKFQMPDMTALRAQIQAQVQAAMTQVQAEQKQWNAEQMARVQAELKSAQAELTPEKMAEIQARVKAAEDWWTPQREAELQQRMAEAEKSLRHAQEQMRTSQLDMQQRMQAAQSHLGEAEVRLSGKIDQQMQQIIQELLASGKARPVR